MKNRYFGNFIICSSCDENIRNINDPFDAIQVDSKNEEIAFDIVLFLNGEIKENTDVCFFLTIRPLGSEYDSLFMPLVAQNTNVKKEELFMEASHIEVETVSFPKEGLYALELNVVEKHINIDEIDSALLQVEESEIISRFTLNVAYSQ